MQFMSPVTASRPHYVMTGGTRSAVSQSKSLNMNNERLIVEVEQHTIIYDTTDPFYNLCHAGEAKLAVCCCFFYTQFIAGTRLDIIHEESDDTSEIEWCIDILDPDYNPLYDSSSSSEDDSGKTPDKAFDKLSREEDDHRRGKCTIHKHKSQRTYAKQKKNRTESTVTIKTSKRPTSTRVTRRKRSRKVDDDGGYDTSEDQSSDIDELPKQKVRRPWSEAERAAVNRHMSRFTEERRVPGKEDCVRCLMKEKSLKLRSWKDVKNFVYNTIVTLNRRSVTRKLNY
ncbi:hypothetical protein GBF38_004886 [Nibea albiflora]|uniref:Uncharacterized protein n=1 Tax=Nibea albiflora TaxID=240163 RepID=A0ACB7EUX6_NIBAL|nr:hypothetical protein GBF38_004886 [Nibea albiflora]